MQSILKTESMITSLNVHGTVDLYRD